MLNIEQLFFKLLQQSLPDIEFAPELDVDSIDRFPFVTFSATGGNALDSSGPKPNGWDCFLSLEVFDDDLDHAIEVAGQIYDAVWSWNDPWGGTNSVKDLGHVAEIDDQSIFTRVGSVAIGSRSITQLAGSFTLQAHQA